jgi:hypothetical protein
MGNYYASLLDKDLLRESDNSSDLDILMSVTFIG